MHIRPLLKEDWPSVKQIYQQGIDTGIATFETECPDWDQWDQNHHHKCRIIMEHEGEILGWAALLPVSNRLVYRGLAEVSIYLSEESRGKGLGKKLLQELIINSEAEGFWTLQSVLLVENIVSYYLHLKLGFREVGRRQRIAWYQNRWHDTVLLERRSDHFTTEPR